MASFEPRRESGDRETPTPAPDPGPALNLAHEPLLTAQQVLDERDSPQPWGWTPSGDVAPGQYVVKGPVETSPLLEAAPDLVKDTPERRALREKLDAFERLGDAAKEKATPGIREDIAHVVARAVTEQHQRTAMLDAWATFSNDPNLAQSDPAERREQHPQVAQLLHAAEDLLAALGKEILIETLLPGAHILLPPTDLMDSVFTAMTMVKIAEHPAPFEIEDQPPWLKIAGPAAWP